MAEFVFDHLDLSQLSFPSSKATLGQIIAPVMANKYELHDLLEPIEDQLEELHVNLRTEHELAAILYARATDQDYVRLLRELHYEDYANVVTALNKQYVRLGISSGQHQTDELIRDVEAQVVSQIPGHHRDA